MPRLLVVAAAVAALTAVLAHGAGPRERLPAAKPGAILPSAAGVVLGKTTKAQLLKRWGPASQCHGAPFPVCNWFIGTGFTLADMVGTALVPRSNVVYLVSFYSKSWRKSRLRGWRLPGGIKIGTPFGALKQAYPKLRWARSAATGSTWLVSRYDFGGQVYSLSFMLDRGARERASGHVLKLEVLWYGPPLECKLASEPAAGPEGEPDGRRIRGSCSGATRSRLDEAAQPGGIRPIRLEFEPRGGSRITSVKAPRCFGEPVASGGYADCRADAQGWPVDVTLGFDAAPGGVDVTVRQPAGIPPEVARELRIRLP